MSSLPSFTAQAHPQPHGGSYREWIVCAGLVLAVATVSTLLVYLPMFGQAVSVTSDGQRAAYFEPFVIWSQWFAGGWPAYADPTSMAFYPPKYLAQWLGFGLDGFAAISLVVAGAGGGVLAWALTRDRLAASFAAAVTPALGFFGAHLSHTSIMHATAWAPLMMLAGWGLSRPAANRAPWAGLLGLSLGLSLLAGHPQLSVYALVATVAVAIPQQIRSPRDWIGVALWGTLGTAIGMAIALPQLMPSLEFASFSGRAVMEGKFLAEFSASPGSMLLNVFPFIRGGNWVGGAEIPYQGLGSWAEVVSAIGVALLALAAIGAGRTSRKADWWRFGLLGLFAAILSILPASEEVAKFLVDVPVLGQFRAWARWLFVSSLCLLQMAAIGIASMRSGDGLKPRAWLKSFALVVVVAWVAAIMLSLAKTGPRPVEVFFSSPTVIQLFVGVAMLLALSVALKRPRPWLLTAALAACALLPLAELAHLSRSMAWANTLMHTDGDASRADIAKVQALLRDGGRLVSMSGWQSPHLNADESRLHRIPSLNWYGPLLNQRLAQVSGLTSGGWTRDEVLSDNNQALDIYGVSVVETYAGLSPGTAGDWMPPVTSDGVRLGPGCNEANPATLEVGLDTELPVSQIRLYTSLACSMAIVQGERVATVLASTGGATPSETALVAGENTAEWAHDCVTSPPAGWHANPGAAAQVALPDPAAACTGLVFATVLQTPAPAGDTGTFRIDYVAASGGLIVHGASLDINGRTYPVGAGLMRALASKRWEIAGVTDGGAFLLKNRRHLPRFRFVDGAVRLADPEALAAIQQSRLPDGSAFDARTTAILETTVELPAPAAASAEAVRIVESRGSRFVLGFAARPAPTLLVFGDNYSRHWRASAAGQNLDVLRTNFNQMSVLVPASATELRFDYVDRTMRGGLVAAVTASLLALFLLFGTLLRAGWRRRGGA